MDEQKALQLIKALIDVSIKRGVFENLEATLELSNAFNFVAEKLLKKDNE
jgi:hypothetical protein